MATIIALQACRHGIGCSHLAANLAVILMQQGYRVGLVDTDLKLGGIRTLFNLPKAASLSPDDTYWWLSSPWAHAATLNVDVCRYGNRANLESGGIYLPPLGDPFAIAGRLFQVLQQQYGEEQPFEILQALSRELALDFLIVDNQPEMTESDLLALAISDMAFIMMQLAPYDLQRTAVVLEVAQQLGIDKTWLVPTLVLPNVEAGVVKHMLESTYGQTVAGILYLTDAMANFASHGIFCLHHPDHPLTQTMRAIAAQIEQNFQTLSPSSTGAEC